MLEAIGAGSRRMVGTKDWADLWLESPELVQVKVEIEELKKQGLANDESSDAHLHDECEYFSAHSSFLANGAFERCHFFRAAAPHRRAADSVELLARS